MIRKVQDALKLSKVKSKLPRNPKVVDIRVEDYVDSDGEDALRVTIVIDDDVDVEKVSGQDLSASKPKRRWRSAAAVMAWLRSSSGGRAQAPAYETGPGIRSHRAVYRRSAMPLHTRQRVSP
jgi:hypothetical protein